MKVGTFVFHFFVLQGIWTVMDTTAIANQVRNLIEPLLTSRRVELVELTCHYGGGRLVLRCLMDTVRGITLDELSNLNRAIGALLDEHEVVSEHYLLEVSSPGLDRPLKRWTDFDRVIGRRLRVVRAVQPGSSQEHRGELLSVNEEAIVLRLDSGDKLQIPLSEITYAVQEIGLR